MAEAALTDRIEGALADGGVAGALLLCSAHLERAPDDAAAHRHLGLLHAAAGAKGSAVDACKRACELASDDPRSWSDLGRVLAMFGDMEDAARCFAEAVEIDARFADGWHNLGTALKQSGRSRAALTALRNALLIEPGRADTYLNLSALLAEAGQYEDAVEALERAVACDGNLPSARSRLAAHLSGLGKVRRAEALFRQSLAMNPDHMDGWLGLGRALEDLGEADGAGAAYLNALRRRPDHAQALGAWLALQPGTADGEARTLVDKAARIVRDGAVRAEARALVGYGLAKYHDRRGDPASAAQAGRLANEARRRHAGALDRAALTARVDGIISAYSPEFFAARRRFGVGTEQPVFIVGLPRSGTTLTEQILASHPQLHGAGELPDLGRLAASVPGDEDAMWRAAARLDERGSRHLAGEYLRRLRDGAAKGRLRISDKSPLNFFQLAFAALLFPGARVIHCRRDPRDTALSIWMENFNPDQHYATDFGDLAHFTGEYERLMAHWREVLPLRCLEVTYEDTVADLEGQARRIMGFLGVPWNDRCLDFHTSERAVQTPSRWQVRRPIYSRSVGRWRAYAPHLPELAAAFARPV